MTPLFFIFIVIAFVYFTFGWVLPHALAWLVKRRYKIHLRIGRIFFPYLTLRNVIIAKNGFTIEIEDIAVRSSLFSSDVVKLLAVVMRNVKINKNIPVNPGENGNDDDDDDDSLAEAVSLPLDFRNTKIPSIIITFVQFMAVHIDDVNLHALGNGWLVNGSAESLNLDGSVVHGARTLLTSIAVTGGVMKLHRNSSDSCLSQIHFAGTIEATLRAQGELTFENLSVKIGSSSVIVGQEDTTIPCLEGAMKNFQVNARLHPDEFQINLTIKLEALSLRGKMPVLSLRSLSIDSRIKDEILKIKSQLNSLYLTYDHSDWEKLLLLGKRDDKSASKNLTPSKSRYLNLSWLNEIKTTTDLLDGSLIVRLPDVQEASCGIARISVSLNRKNLYEKWTKKLTIESLRCTLNGSDSVIPETAHHWGNPISVGVLIATTHPNAVGIVMDLLRVEWNLDLAKFLEKSFEYYNENWKRIFLLSRENDNLIINKQKLDNDLNKTYNQLNLKISNCNLFLIASNEMSIMLRIDSSNMENIEKRFVIVGEGICAITLNRNEPIMCEHAKSIKRPFLTIRKCKCAIKNQLLNINIDESGIVWSPNLHLRILQLWDESLNFRKFIKLNKINNNNINQKYNYDIYATSDMTITIDIDNQKHFLQLSTDELHLSENEWKLNYLRCSLNNADIITIEGFKFIKLNDSIDVRLERKNNEDFILDWNETWELNIDSAKACFPYEHKFAEAIQNKLLSIRKWLKEIHSSKDSPKNNSERLYCDLVIKIREWIFEVSDDPFEVRLRDIYQLLEDEYKESLKRQSMLTAKVKELCRTHLLLPQGKVEELYASLNKKNAETYVKRWRQMQRSGPRTRLFAWIMQDIEIIAVADPTITGIKNATKAIAKIDSESLWPDDGIDFSILWVRGISMKIAEWKLQLRDFPQPLLLVEGLSIWGRLGGAEALAPKRAKRTVIIQVGDPWSDIIVERGMTSLKYYHDLNWDIDKFRYAFGPCWEPVIAQCNLSFEKILHPSRDPSPPLPFWDKMRLALHGRLTLCVKQLTVLLHASLDPYNTTEEMELTWSNLELDWTLGKIIIKGDLDVYVRTASKYDDCRLLHLPNVRLSIKLNWICLGDSRDHHAAIPCAPDRLPEYSSNQEHDSFRAFRSQNINVSLSMETKPNGTPTNSGQAPTAVLYGSTLRWFENLKFILSGATRPTRKGRLFNNIRPRKKQLSRHYKNVRLTLAFHKFHVSYWMSFSMQRGFEITCGRVACSSEHNLSLNPINDGLIHRHRASWSIIYMNCELNDAEIWLKSALQDDDEEKITSSLRQPVEKCYFLSVTLVSYGRDELICIGGIQGGDTPTHRLVVHDLKGAWTKTNRDVAFALFDSFIKTQQLKKNLSTAALKGFHLPDKVQNSNQQQKIRRSMDLQNSTNSNDVSPSTSSSPSSSASTAAAAAVTNNEDVKKKSSSSSATTVTTAGTTTATTTSSSSSTATTTTTTVTSSSASSSSSTTTATKSDTDATGKSATSKIYQTEGAEMLQRLIAEAPNKPVVFSDDLSVQTRGHQLRGLAACNQDDLLHTNWHIALVNSQVLLKGIETKGYVILSAAKAEIFQRVHRPVWREQRTLVSKTTWLGSLECMQYYATVSANIDDNIDDNNIMWLSLDNIQEKDSTIISGLPDVPALVGSGQSVGGVVSQTVGGGGGLQHQLQRIVSRCKCEFFYACYGQTIDSIELDKVPAPPREEVIPWERKDLSAADAFTLMHHDLDVCTNSLQYTMLLDVVNNLLLYVEPRRKEANEKLQRMRFQLQLQSIDDQKKPIQQLQNTVRGLVAKLRRLERETYLIEKALAEELINHELHSEMKLLEKRVYDCKELLCAKAEELDVMLNCYKETIATTQQPATLKDRQATLTRAAEICFKHAQWRLTDADGLLGIADLILTNFLYTKTSKTDDSVEHLLELGYVRMMNLLPNQIYTEVLTPTELQSNMPVDRQRALRVFCREKAPVAGISVKEHFEINVVPLTIGLTKKFFNTMLKFCFPERDPDGIEEPPAPQQRDSSFYVQIERRDDIEKMKERADKNKLFIYIKIPEVPVRVSYKGNKDKNIEDVRDFALVIPTLEYHNVTWTWLDLLLAMKSDSRRVILSQAIKQKLQIKPRNTQEETTPQEEDKARLLLGARHLPGDARKKSVFKFK